MKYDYIIKNGQLADFDAMTFVKGDIYIKDGYIVEPADGDVAEATEVVDADGKYVLPGLIDEHGHFNYQGSNIGTNPDLVCPASGVTTAVDAGTCGFANFELFQKANVSRFTTDLLAYLHVSPYGVHSSIVHEEEHDPVDFKEDKIIPLFEKYSDTIRGLKVRMSKETTSGLGTRPLVRAIEIADKLESRGFHAPVDMHFSALPDDSSVEEIVKILRPGDIFTHVFQNKGETVFDKEGRVRDCVKAARKRGVLFDCCNGRIHWSFNNLKAAIADGFLPDIISSDIIRESTFIRPGFSLMHAMNTLFISGMELIDIFRAVTLNPARVLKIEDRAASLAPGREADVAIIDVMKTPVHFFDRFDTEIDAEEVLVPLMTIKYGESVFRQIYF